MMTSPELDLSAGLYVKGVVVDDTTFLASATFRQLRVITRDPMTLQTARRHTNDDPELAEDRDLHDLVQRAIAGSKKSNIPRYAHYIEGILAGEDGVLPPIHLWARNELETPTVGSATYALVPHGDTMLAIDGETQLSSHWQIARSPNDDLRKKHSNQALAVVLHHGISARTARQYFHDLNILAVRPNVGIGLSMDTKDPIMQVVNDVEALPVLTGRVERQARQLPKRSDKVVTLSALRQMIIDIAKGISGVQYGSRPAPIEETELTRLSRVAPKVVNTYFRRYEKEIIDRDNYLAGTAPVLAAVGAMNQPVTQAGPDDEDDAIEIAMRKLDEVDWSRDQTWQGIAGDFTPRGVFSVKGTKEVSYAVYNALSDPTSSSYERIRRPAR